MSSHRAHRVPDLDRPLLCLVTALILVVCCGCARIVGQPLAGDGVISVPVGTGFVHGTDGGPDDQLAAAAVTDVDAFWRQSFPTVFHRKWTDPRFDSVDTDGGGPPPPCADSVAEVSGSALYCPSADTVVWDRTALLPVLREQFGDAAVVIVLAHELGHAVQARTGLTPAVEQADPARYPSLLLESMADCYAGAFLRWAVDGHAPHLRLDRADLDPALSALVNFADPVGATTAAHGDALDRVTAFSDGYDGGPGRCAGMTTTNHTWTVVRFAATPPASVNRDVGGEVAALAPDLAAYFGALAGPSWRAPAVRLRTGAPDCGGSQGPVALCGGTVEVSTGNPLAGQDTELGDYATGLLLAARFALAAESARHRPVTGPAASRAAPCLAGAYTADRLSPGRTGVQLTIGDLDVAVQALLAGDAAARDLRGTANGTGFDRVTAFRAGFTGGPAACGPG